MSKKRKKENKVVRLQKFLSMAGVASRRKAEELIRERRVTVNGRVASLGDKIELGRDKIKVDNQPIENREQFYYYKLYKPPGYITSFRDPQGRPTIKDLIADLPHRVFPVGRLDYHSEGLILLTNEGELANALMHPSKGVPRIYHVKVRGNPPDSKLQKLVEGVKLEDGIASAVYVERLQQTHKGNLWFEIMLQEGRYREIRRMCEAIGYWVNRLVRVQYGSVKLEGLYPGQFAPLTPQEISSLYEMVELPVPDSISLLLD